MAFFAHGTQKPTFSNRINPEHPFTRGHLLTIPFNHVHARHKSSPDDYVGIWGGATPRQITNNGIVVRTSNREGSCVQAAASNQYLDLGGDFVPTSGATFLVIRRKLDTTNRTAALFSVGGDDSTTCDALCPWSDGVVYWDFGGFSSPNRLTVSGLSFSTTTPERWVFTAGPRGSAIWQNGVKVASQATAVTRSGQSGNVTLNYRNPGATGDLQDLNFFQVNNYQWSDELCRWWSAEPYAHLYPHTAQRRYFLLGDLAAAAGGAFKFRRTLGAHGTRIASRQEHLR
jgi:hypothetical protein